LRSKEGIANATTASGMIDASILIEISNEELSMHTYDRLDNQIDQAYGTPAAAERVIAA